MRRTMFASVGLILVLLVGCHHDKHNLKVSYPEEYTLPPDEARFNNPPESGYRKPPPKKEFKAGPGGGGGGGGAVGSGFGNNGAGGSSR